MKGTAIAALDAVDPVLVHYEIECDAGWNTRQVEVQCAHGATHQQLKLQADSGIWRRDGQLLPDVNGCLDVDISITPATNTLPIRRLQFATGVSQEVTAAWIKIPELTVEPLAQRYTKIDHYQYQYESSNNFIAKLEVDDQSMIVRYADLWQRLALYK